MTDNTQSIFDQQMSEEIWDTNYRAPEEVDVMETWRRQAVACAVIEKEEIRQEIEDDFYWLLSGFRAAGGGRITANLGVAERVATTLMNCFVFDATPTISPKGVDSIEGIYKLLEKQAQTLKSEGGYGHNFSWVRPEGTYIEGIGSRTPGVVSFMGLWNESSKIITQGSEKVVGEIRKEEKKKIRKGAMMGVLDVYHPDIFRFIDAKLQEGVLDKFNLSVGIIDGFMEALELDADWDLRFPDSNFEKYDDEWDGDIELWESKGYPVHIYETVKAKTLWDYIMNSTYTRNDPGVLYTGLANKLNPLWYCEVIRASNPCGEIMMPTGVCNLMSINLPRFYSKDHGFDWKGFARAVTIAVRFSDNINDISPVPLDEYKQSMIDKRRIGIGTLGIGSLLFMMGMPFNSEEGLAFQDEIAKFKCETELLASARLGEEKGSFRLFDAEKYFTESYYWKTLPISDEVKAEVEAIGCMRNSHQSANAPTGNMSIYLGMVSGGIEPVFSTEYNRFAIVVEAERAKLRKEGLKFPDIFKGEWFETDIFKENNRGNDSVLRGTFNGVNYEIDKNRGITKENRVMDYGYKWCEDNLTAEEFAEYEARGVFSTAQTLSAEDHLHSLAIFAKYTNQNNSKTINLPKDYPFIDFQDIYKTAYDMGIKGTTTYREGTMTAVLENIKDDQDDLEEVFDTDEVIQDNVKLPDEYISNGYVIRDNNKKKWYVNIAFTDHSKTKPFAIFVHTNSSEGSEVTSETIDQLIQLAVEKGIKPELVAVHEYKLKKVSNVVKIARTIGLLLRHNISIIDIVNVLDEGEYPLASFTFHIKRLLKQFIKDGEKVTGDRGVCPECGGQIIYQEGCIMCMQCGWSKCG